MLVPLLVAAAVAVEPAALVPARAQAALLATDLGVAAGHVTELLRSAGHRLPYLSPSSQGREQRRLLGVDLLDESDRFDAGVDSGGAAAAFALADGTVVASLPIRDAARARERWSGWALATGGVAQRPKRSGGVTLIAVKHGTRVDAAYALASGRLLVCPSSRDPLAALAVALAAGKKPLAKDAAFKAAFAAVPASPLRAWLRGEPKSALAAVGAALFPATGGLRVDGRAVAAARALLADAPAPAWSAPSGSFAIVRASLGPGGVGALRELFRRANLDAGLVPDAPRFAAAATGIDYRARRLEQVVRSVVAPSDALSTGAGADALVADFSAAEVLAALRPLTPLMALEGEVPAALIGVKLTASPLLRALGPARLTARADGKDGRFHLDAPIAP